MTRSFIRRCLILTAIAVVAWALGHALVHYVTLFEARPVCSHEGEIEGPFDWRFQHQVAQRIALGYGARLSRSEPRRVLTSLSYVFEDAGLKEKWTAEDYWLTVEDRMGCLTCGVRWDGEKPAWPGAVYPYSPCEDIRSVAVRGDLDPFLVAYVHVCLWGYPVPAGYKLSDGFCQGKEPAYQQTPAPDAELRYPPDAVWQAMSAARPELGRPTRW